MNTSSFLVSPNGSIPTEAAKVFVNPLKVGDILVASGGYEADISTFYRCESVTAKTVTLVELEQTRDYSPNMGGMYWTAFPVLDHVYRRIGVKKVNVRDGHPMVKISDYRYAYLWDGKKMENYNVH